MEELHSSVEEPVEAEGACKAPSEEKPTRGERAKEVFFTHFTPQRMAYMAIFTALAFAVTFLEFPVFPAAPFLKLDFANVFFLIEGFIFGPVEAVISIAIKELLCLFKSQTGGTGEVANFLTSTAYVLAPAVGYRFKKGRGWVVAFLATASVFQIAISLLVNRFINFPLYGALFGFDGVQTFRALWQFVLLFNLIKSVAISVVVFVVYKPLSRFIKRTSAKFSRKKKEGK